jgi:hypothetical protein
VADEDDDVVELVEGIEVDELEELVSTLDVAALELAAVLLEEEVELDALLDTDVFL